MHTPAYLRQLQSAVRHAPTALDADTRVSKQSYDVARRAVGGVLAAVDAVMAGRTTNAFAALRPGGLLVLGRTESLVALPQAALEHVDTTHRIFRRVA